jgi:hypothetical protein
VTLLYWFRQPSTGQHFEQEHRQPPAQSWLRERGCTGEPENGGNGGDGGDVHGDA